MGATSGLILLTILCASVRGATGACKHVRNDDMIEYSCVGGHISDLNNLPESTGKIRISNMPIYRITADTFSRFGSELWVLGCSHCGIVDIEPNAFRRLENLQQLSLDNNDLTTVKESWFKGLNYLTYLDLNYNKIQDIEDGVFENLPGLVDLRLSGNRLQCLNLEDMSKLDKLKRMFISENFDFKCPNAVSAFLESRDISFDKDPAWSAISSDLIPVRLPPEYDSYDTEVTPTPTTPLPAYRQRLHLPTTTQRIEPEPRNTPPTYFSTEEIVIYPSEHSTPYQATKPPMASTPIYRGIPTMAPTMPLPSDDDVRTQYVPSRTIPPTDTIYLPYATTSQIDVTTRSWPTVATSTRPESPAYPPSMDTDQHHESSHSSSEHSKPPIWAASTKGDRETSFIDDDMDYTTDPYSVLSSNYDESLSRTKGIAEKDRVQYPLTETPHMPPLVKPLPPELPMSEVDQSAPPDSSFQQSQYETPPAVRPPVLENYQHQTENPSTVQIMETTTDKPLPYCPNNSSALSVVQSYQMIVITVLLIVMRDVLVEGF